MKVEGEYIYANSTKQYYINTFENHIKNSIGQQKITKLHYLQLQSYFNKLSDKGKATNKNIKKVFCVTFKYALKNGYIKENPMPMIEARGCDNTIEQHVISIDELESIINSLLETKQGRKPTFTTYSICVFLYLGYFLGTRKSETLALEKSDIDFNFNKVTINKRLEYHGLKRDDFFVTDRLKTKSSNSTQPLCNSLSSILESWFKYNPYDLICCTEEGKYLNPTDIDCVIRNHCEKLGIKFRTHDLRRSFVTNLVKSNIDVKTVSELARHTDVKTTLEIYTKISEDDKENAINDVFNTPHYKIAPKNHPKTENCLLN